MTCRRCGAPLVETIAGVIACLACHKRDHEEVDRLVAGLRAEADRQHQQLTAQAEAWAAKHPGAAA